MLKNPEDILQTLQEVRLSEHERSGLRTRLLNHLHEHPMFARRASWYSRLISDFENALNARMFFAHPVYAACVLVLCVSVGTSFAAQQSLPGQALYALKTRVNEPIQGALALTPLERAQWSAELTNRRLQEAEALVAMDTLSPVASANIETGLDSAVKLFNSNLSELSKVDDLRAVSMQSELEASLNAHETVLAALPTKHGEDTQILVSAVRNHAERIQNERSAVEATLTATDSPFVKTAALAQKKNTEDEIQRVQSLATETPDTQIGTAVRMVAAEAQQDVKAGENEGNRGRWGRAYSAFQDAYRKVKETKDNASTRNWLKNRFGVSFPGSPSAATTTAATTTESVSSTTQSSSTGSEME